MRAGTLEYQLNAYENREAAGQAAWERSIHEAQDGSTGLMLAPEGDEWSLADYVDPTSKGVGLCPHGCPEEDGRRTGGPYHLNEDMDAWEPCDEYVDYDRLAGDPRYRTYPLE